MGGQFSLKTSSGDRSSRLDDVSLLSELDTDQLPLVSGNQMELVNGNVEDEVAMVTTISMLTLSCLFTWSATVPPIWSSLARKRQM